MKFYILLVISILALISPVFAQKQANILWIITDDQRADALSCFNEQVTGSKESPLGYVESPNIDKLAEEGVLFVNAYCNSPACAPSRGSMHTGRYPHHNGIYGFEQTHDQPDFFKATVPQVLDKAGYQTARFGKSGYYIFQWGPGLTWKDLGFYDYVIDNKNNLQVNGLTDFYSKAIWEGGLKVGTQEIFYYPDGTTKSYYRDRSGGLTQEDVNARLALDKEQDILRSYPRSNTLMIIGGESTMPAGQTLDGHINDQYSKYLGAMNTYFKGIGGSNILGPFSAKPLFVHLGYHLPHSPILPPKKYRDRFKDKIYKVPEFSKSELDKLPPQLVTCYEKMKIDELKPEEMQQAIRDYYAFCAYGDELIGKAIADFKTYSKKSGREYLIILTCGDHGWHLNENGIEAKFAPWSASNHTGVIVSSSDKTKFPDGKVYRDFVEFVDFAPTILSFAGLNTKHEQYGYLDGYDLSELIKNDTLTREYALGEMNHVYGPRAYMRTKRFAFSMRARDKNTKPNSTNYLPNNNIRWALDTHRKNAEMALYDLRIDPKERNNVANDPTYAELADWFRVKLGNIVLGDGRIECDWASENVYDISNFAKGSDDKKLDIPIEIIPQITGFTELPSEVNLSIYPNPSNDFFNLKITGNGVVEMNAYNMSGQKLDTFPPTFSNQIGKDWEAGTYHLEVKGEDFKHIVKLVKR